MSLECPCQETCLVNMTKLICDTAVKDLTRETYMHSHWIDLQEAKSIIWCNVNNSSTLG